LKHLAVLRREKLLSEWFDQKILAGGEIDKEVSLNLDGCDLFLPLVSPDFLSSNYCYETEMKRAMERHEAGTMRIVPLIVEPCDWKASPLQRFKALPRDGKPISEWTNANNAYLDIVTELRRLIEDRSASASGAPDEETTGSIKAPDRRKYRVKRDFDEIDEGDFRRSAFETIRDYFKVSSEEISSIEGIKARFGAMAGDAFTCTVVNRSRRQGTAHITVHAKSGRMALGDIIYSFQERAESNTANGSFSVAHDDYDLFFKSDAFGLRDKLDRLSPRDAAEELWQEFLEHAGISDD
jgi:hypothetical protein